MKRETKPTEEKPQSYAFVLPQYDEPWSITKATIARLGSEIEV